MGKRFMAVILAALCGVGVAVAEMVAVPGTAVQFPTPIERKIGDQQVKLVLTGAALRKKVVFNIYAIGSYLQEGVKLASAEELAAADCPKQLHLVMERDLSGKDLYEAFKSAIRLNYPEPAFAAELATLGQVLTPHQVYKGNQIRLTHVPGVGLHCSLIGKTDFAINNVAFARAVWEIYLGKNNLGENIKKDLSSRL